MGTLAYEQFPVLLFITLPCILSIIKQEELNHRLACVFYYNNVNPR